MKKRKLTGLSLNKNIISNIQTQTIKGGGASTNCYPTAQTGCNTGICEYSGNTCDLSECACL